MLVYEICLWYAEFLILMDFIRKFSLLTCKPKGQYGNIFSFYRC